MRLHDARPRTYPRPVGTDLPGVILSGWAPARAVLLPAQVAVRDLSGPGDESLRSGVAFGMAEVSAAAQFTRARVVFHRLDAQAPCRDVSTEVVVSRMDPEFIGDMPGGPVRILTCPLSEWRPDVWSVASGPEQSTGRMRTCDWHHTLSRSGAQQLNARFRQHTGKPMDEAAWRGWMAVKVAYEAALRAQAGEDDLLALEFDGYKGAPLRFAENGHLRQPTFRITGSRIVTVPPSEFADDEYA